MRSDKDKYNHAVLSGTYKNNDLYYYGHSEPRNGDGSDDKASLRKQLKAKVEKSNLSGENKFPESYLGKKYYKKICVVVL